MGLSAASVGLVVESGRGIDLPHWSVSSRVVFACWGSGFYWDSKQDFLFLGASSCLFVLQVPPPGFEMCPGLVPSGGSIPPPGFGFGCCCCSRATCNLPCLLLCVLRSSVVLRAVPPPLGVRCALFSVFVGVGRFSGVNKIGRLFGGASPSGFAFGPARSHDSTQNP